MPLQHSQLRRDLCALVVQGFHSSFKRCRYDLERWRTISSLQPHQTAILDANNGAGWELAGMLLRPRKVQVLADGHVYFTNEGKQRPSAEQALKSRFVIAAQRRSAPPVEAVTSGDDAQGAEGTTQGRGLFGMFRRLQRRLTHLETDFVRTVCSAPTALSSPCHLRSTVASMHIAEAFVLACVLVSAGGLMHLSAASDWSAKAGCLQETSCAGRAGRGGDDDGDALAQGGGGGQGAGRRAHQG